QLTQGTTRGQCDILKKEVLVAESADKQHEIVSALLMTHAPLMNFAVLTTLNEVLTKEKNEAQCTGNRCSLHITYAPTELTDLFSSYGEGVPSYEPLKVRTKQSKEWVMQWKKAKAQFARTNLTL